jgi:hypothetical protein
MRIQLPVAQLVTLQKEEFFSLGHGLSLVLASALELSRQFELRNEAVL